MTMGAIITIIEHRIVWKTDGILNISSCSNRNHTVKWI